MGHGGCLNACACLVGSDVNSVDFVDSGSAMRKTVARQNAKLEGGSSKPDFVIWEIEVPKVTSCWPAHHPALPYTATSWSSRSGAGSVPSQGDQQQVQEGWSILRPLGLTGVRSQCTTVNKQHSRATPRGMVLVELVIPHYLPPSLGVQCFESIQEALRVHRY